MHYVISATWGPTDVTRAALPFVFAATALQAGDTVLLMLFHDAVTIAVDGTHQKMIPFGPPAKFAEVRSISENMLVHNAVFGGMNDLHQHTSRSDAKFISF